MTTKYGTPAQKLSRTDSPSTSKEASYSIDTTKLEQLVYETIKSYGSEGCISQNVLTALSHLAYSSVTARFSALERKGLIHYKGDKRKGASGRSQRVMRAV